MGTYAKCNVCFQPVQGQCFRTHCSHLFCERCAFAHFSENDLCSVCQARVTDSEIPELMVGMASTALRSSVFQAAFEDPKWENISQRTGEAVSAVGELICFVLEQLHVDVLRYQQTTNELQRDNEEKQQENMRLSLQLRNQSAQAEQRVKDTEFKLQVKERELLDLQEAYKEKMRKCNAWEKLEHGTGVKVPTTLASGNVPPPVPSPPSRQSPTTGMSPTGTSYGLLRDREPNGSGLSLLRRHGGSHSGLAMMQRRTMSPPLQQQQQRATIPGLGNLAAAKRDIPQFNFRNSGRSSDGKNGFTASRTTGTSFFTRPKFT